MSNDYKSINAKEDTFDKFREMKKTVAATMTDDEFLNVLLVAYRNRKI